MMGVELLKVHKWASVCMHQLWRRLLGQVEVENQNIHFQCERQMGLCVSFFLNLRSHIILKWGYISRFIRYKSTTGSVNHSTSFPWEASDSLKAVQFCNTVFRINKTLMLWLPSYPYIGMVGLLKELNYNLEQSRWLQCPLGSPPIETPKLVVLSMHHLLVVGHWALDLHPKIDYRASEANLEFF